MICWLKSRLIEQIGAIEQMTWDIDQHPNWLFINRQEASKTILLGSTGIQTQLKTTYTQCGSQVLDVFVSSFVCKVHPKLCKSQPPKDLRKHQPPLKDQRKTPNLKVDFVFFEAFVKDLKNLNKSPLKPHLFISYPVAQKRFLGPGPWRRAWCLWSRWQGPWKGPGKLRANGAKSKNPKKVQQRPKKSYHGFRFFWGFRE